MVKRVCWTVGVFSLGAMVGSSPAATVLVDGFETVPGSTDGTGDFDPLANNNPHGTNPNGPITEATPEGVQVRTSAVAPGPAEGNQYLRINPGDFYIPFLSPEIVNTQDFSVTFRVYNSSGTGLNLQVGRINAATGPNIGFSNMSWENGQIRRLRHSSEGSGWENIAAFTSGQWDRIGLEYQASGTTLGTFDLYLNDFSAPVATNLLVNNPGFFPPLNNVFFGTRAGAGEVYIDDIDIFEGPMPEEPEPPLADIAFDSRGQLRVAGWLRMNEINYGLGLTYLNNTVTASGTNWVEYENANLDMRKEFVVSNDVITVTMEITPKSVPAQASVVETRLDFATESRTFTHWFQPFTYGNPDFTGRILAAPGAADWDLGFGGATGWEAGAVFAGPAGSFMFDRYRADGFVSVAAGPTRVAADLGEADFPLYTRHFAEWSAAQTTHDSTVRDNAFLPGVNTVTYALRMYDTSDPDEAIRLASKDFFRVRRDYWLTEHPEAAAVSTPPSTSIASFSMFAANWGGGPPDIVNIQGVAANAKGNLILYRQMLDAAGLQDFELYFWIMLYEPDTRGGWGDLPTPEKPAPLSDTAYLNGLRDYFADLKSNVANLKVGLYVNLWAAWENSTVYTAHPTWFRARSMTNDGGGTAFFGKLLDYGRHLYDPSFTPAEASVPEMIQSYDLDFVFFDNGGFADAVAGSLAQQKTFFSNLVQSVHDVGALAIPNGRNPYMDLNYVERLSGLTPDNDKWFVDSYAEAFTVPRACLPLLQRIGSDYTFAVPGFFLNGYTDDPGFVPYFPAHFSDPIVQNGYQDWVDILRARKLAATPPTITHAAPVSGGAAWELRWTSIGGATYGIESAADLTAGFSQVLTSGVAATPPENTNTISYPAAGTSAFRVFGQ